MKHVDIHAHWNFLCSEMRAQRFIYDQVKIYVKHFVHKYYL